MTKFIETLDSWFSSYISVVYPEVNFLKSFGYCEQVFRTIDGKPTPIVVTINGTSDRGNVTLDDRYKLCTWFRVQNPITKGKTIENNDWAFGFQDNPVQRAPLEWFIAWRVETGEDLAFNLLEHIPGFLIVQGYQVASIDRSSIQLDPDHEKIYRQELGDTVYEKHRFPWNIVRITMNLEYIINPNCNATGCEDCPENSFVTQSGDCLIPN